MSERTRTLGHPVESRMDRIRREARAGLRALKEQLIGLTVDEVAQLKTAQPQQPLSLNAQPSTLNPEQ